MAAAGVDLGVIPRLSVIRTFYIVEQIQNECRKKATLDMPNYAVTGTIGTRCHPGKVTDTRHMIAPDLSHRDGCGKAVYERLLREADLHSISSEDASIHNVIF